MKVTFSPIIRAMNEAHPMEQAIAKVGLIRVAAACGKTHQAVRKWQRAGRMPRTEWTGETDYAKRIEQLCGGSPTADQLLKPWPKWPADDAKPSPFPGLGIATQGSV
jgi:hypothetical protein